MKVRKLLVEADAHTIEEVKRKFTNDPDSNSKLQTLKGFLINSCKLNPNIWPSLERLGNNLLFSWIESFKFEEAGRDGNEFIAALNHPGSDMFITQTDDRFVKAYNAYASGYIDKNELEDSPLYNPHLYKNSENDVKQILSYWNQLYNRFDHNDLMEIFYEDPLQGDKLRTLAEIQAKINDLRINNTTEVKSINDKDKETLKSLIDKSADLKNYARELLSNENNNQR